MYCHYVDPSTILVPATMLTLLQSLYLPRCWPFYNPCTYHYADSSTILVPAATMLTLLKSLYLQLCWPFYNPCTCHYADPSTILVPATMLTRLPVLGAGFVSVSASSWKILEWITAGSFKDVLFVKYRTASIGPVTTEHQNTNNFQIVCH